MALTLRSGLASNVQLGSDYSYAATSNHGPVAIKNQLVSLRIESRPVLFRTRTLPSISEGDVVAVVGHEKNGTLEALVLKNVTTEAFYAPPTVMPMVLSVLLILIGIPLIALLGLGLLFVGFGGYVLYRVICVRRAISMLRDHQAAPAPARVAG
ncbi:MAG: hypothetical protein KF745_04105 [Phycisphaeraceae bacterium]|nr:hypothetical protein [Phycisphaeraceae bacterium]